MYIGTKDDILYLSLSNIRNESTPYIDTISRGSKGSPTEALKWDEIQCGDPSRLHIGML